MKMIRSKRRQQGFSLIELLIVVGIIGIIAAIAVPSMIASRRATVEGTVKAKLSNVAAQQRVFRSILKKNRYATLSELETTLAGGSTLIGQSDVTAREWTFAEIEGARTATTFGLRAAPDANNPADRSYAIFEDNELRLCPRAGPWTRTCPRVEQ